MKDALGLLSSTASKSVNQSTNLPTIQSIKQPVGVEPQFLDQVVLVSLTSLLSPASWLSLLNCKIGFIQVLHT